MTEDKPKKVKEIEKTAQEKALEIKKKKKELEKKAQENLIPKKIPHTVKLEVLAPVVLTYRVWAESPEQAVELLRYGHMSAPPKPVLSKQKRIKATVYKYGTVMIEFIKQFA